MDMFDIDKRISIHGVGDPLILVHGGSGPRNLEPMIKGLAKHFRVIVPTFPGYLVEDGSLEYSDELYVNFLEDVRNYLGLHNFYLAGVSLGGRTVLNYTLKHQERVAKLIVMAAAGVTGLTPFLIVPFFNKFFAYYYYLKLWDSQYVKKMAIDGLVNQKGETAKWILSWFPKMVANPVIRTNYSQMVAKVGRKKLEWEETLPNLTVQTLILWSSEDELFPLSTADKLANMIPNASLHVLEGYRHLAHVEKPDFYVSRIKEFLEP